MAEESISPLGIAGLPRALRVLRERRGLRQEDLVVILRAEYGISSHPSTISKYETGAMTPGLHVVASILSALGYRFSDLEQLLDTMDEPSRTVRLTPDLEEQAVLLEALLEVCHRMSSRLSNAVGETKQRPSKLEDSK